MWLARKRHPKNLRRHALSAERKWLLRASSRCCSGEDLKISRSRVRRAASPGTSGSSEVEAQSGPALASACRGETSQSVLSAAAKEAFIRRVLFDVGGFALFRRVVVMLRLLQGLIFRRRRIAPRAFLRAIAGRNRWHVAGTHESTPGWGERGTHVAENARRPPNLAVL